MYYLQSRYYNPEIGRFLNADAFAATGQGLLANNMFAYCLNNPVNKVDYSGCEAGSLFNTADEAARDFALCYNGVSISENVEYATVIYKVKVVTKKQITVTKNFLWWTWTETKTITTEEIKYTYKTIKKGRAHGVLPPSAPLFKKAVAYVHTHGAYDANYKNDDFSDYYKKGRRRGDIVYANRKGVPFYLATPLGTLRRYDPSDSSNTEVYTDIPWDVNHPDRS